MSSLCWVDGKPPQKQHLKANARMKWRDGFLDNSLQGDGFINIFLRNSVCQEHLLLPRAHACVSLERVAPPCTYNIAPEDKEVKGVDIFFSLLD